jgi:hypothetical protein
VSSTATARVIAIAIALEIKNDQKNGVDIQSPAAAAKRIKLMEVSQFGCSSALCVYCS